MQPSSGIRAGRIFGIPLYVNPSWFIIFALLTFFLATQILPQQRGGTAPQYWLLGFAVSLLFFGSVVFHELGHSVIAMRYKIPVVSITLFIFGGLARIARDPDSAIQEFNIAIAGPIASFILAAAFFGVYILLPPGVLQVAAGYLSGINALLGVFNLTPGFPMDGGRILRAIVWGITKNFDKATQIASRSGQIIAYMMILLGAWAVFERDSMVSKVLGGWTGGLWLAFIGWYLLSAAQETYSQVAIRNTLVGLRAADIMSSDVPTVARDISLEDYVHEVLRTGRRCHVVTGNGMAVGLVTLHQVQHIPREEWANTSIQAAMVPQSAIQWVMPNEPVTAVLARMQSEDVNQMPVLQEGHIIGMIARDSILRVIQTRMQASRFAEK
ncbi:MAG TPA: site-2 protease family protein [Candidatus Limnocylindrales bacterium]|nr:site-2 protease family protein [Candidatus Limnocylindrales bacterium]